jgi:rare lipoprotein A
MRGDPDLGRWWRLGVIVVVMVAAISAGRLAASETSDEIRYGLASWYGPGFQGEETASGEIFDQRQLVAAHRTLPFGSIVRVTNLENGRRIRLRIIDRGPYGRNYRKGTVIDVSRAAARRLGFIRTGLVRVRLEVISVPD